MLIAQRERHLLQLVVEDRLGLAEHADYRAVNLQNRWAAMNSGGSLVGYNLGDMYGTPRQIRVGVRAEI